ncbi:MAG: FAD-dependent oxidoreductase [Actinomycetales bacterium]|nr:FAD-dependent oxidoreductase [Actinomycetales bacterium]
MSGVGMRVVVVGAGIGGLTAAVALARRGHQVTLIERAPQFEAIGAGLLVAANAVQALAALGIEVRDHGPHAGQVLDAMELRRDNGALLGAVDIAGLRADFGPSYAMTRTHLHRLIADALPGDVDVRLGTTVTSVHARGRDVDVTLADGQTLTADLLVGADGLHSAIRTEVCGLQELRYAGETCWRGLAPMGIGRTAVEAWGDGTRVGAFPMSPDTVYYYLLHVTPQASPAPAWPELREEFTAYVGHGVCGELVAGLSDTPPLHHDLLELPRHVWGVPRAILLGDAAHAMTPNVGQGAAMAIEDALVLARVLDDGIDGALLRYRTLRAPRVQEIASRARQFGQAALVRGRLATGLRAAAFKAAPARYYAASWRAMIGDGVDVVRSVGGSPQD